jgi:imidazolonepropionase-like amidohydrolase
MRKPNLIFSLIILVTILSLTISKAQSDVLIKNVTIIDVKKGLSVNKQNVYINADRIVKISNTSEKENAAKVIVDGTGKFLIPGLWDMHTHNWWNIHFSNLYVSNGVLGVRNMYTPMSMIKPLKDSINNNLLIGPKYFAAGRVLEGANPEFPDWLVVDSLNKIKKALDTLQLEGSDFVKVYSKIPRNVYFELVKEAHKRGMIVEGHLPMSVSAIEASNAGQKSFEHLLGIPDLCTKDSLFKNKYKFNWFAAVMKENDYGTLKIDEQIAAKNFSILKKNNTYICPTLVVWYSYFHPDTLFETNSTLNKLPKDMVGFWSGEISKYRKKDNAYKEMAIKKFETLKKVTYLLYKSGVPLIAGTDAMNPYCYPGYSLHKELELLVECGIPNADVLRMATINAADFFSLKEYGQIKEGNIASIVLLDENPLVNIKNTTKINTVILKGKVLDKTAIQKMKN